MRRRTKAMTEALPGTTDRRLAALLTLLAENATIVISGARIAKEIGVSRSTVWRLVQRLRGVGGQREGQSAPGDAPGIPSGPRGFMRLCFFGQNWRRCKLRS